MKGAANGTAVEQLVSETQRPTSLISRAFTTFTVRTQANSPYGGLIEVFIAFALFNIYSFFNYLKRLFLEALLLSILWTMFHGKLVKSMLNFSNSKLLIFLTVL